VKLDVGMLTHDLKTLPAYARKVEALGYDCLWSAETQHDPYLPLAVAATVTTSIKLGTSIAVAFPRSPMITAHIAWDLQHASDGRFILGLGSQVKGHNERRFSVKYESPGPKMREIVLALRAIWDCWQNGTPLKFKGEFYRFDLMTPFFNPGPIAHPHIPVYIAGVNEYMCRVAGEVCDGLHVHPFNSPKYLREYVHPAVDEGRRKAGRTGASFVYTTSMFAVVADTEEERAARALAVKQQIAFYASTRTYEPVLATHGWQDLIPHLHRKSVEGDWQGMASLITDEMLETFAVTGSYADIGEKIKARYAGLLDSVALYQPYQPSLDDPRLPRFVKEFNLVPSGATLPAR
jgi:probable F420-dependent oxidoreductase